MEARELLLTFIEDEDKALIKKRQGRFFPAQHDQIAKQVKHLFKLLDANESQRFCYHYLRLGHFISVNTEAQLDIVKAAYLATYEWKTQGFDKPLYDVFIAIMLFGFSDAKNIENGQATDVTAYTRYLGVARQINNYSSLSGMIKKIDRFAPYADDETAARILLSLRAVNYLHRDVNPRYVQYYDENCLSFWGMIIILLLNSSTRQQVTADLASLPTDFPKRAEHLDNFHEFHKAVDTFLAAH